MEKLVCEVLASSKYNTVDAGLIRSLGAAELLHRRNFKEAVKATKNKLHQIARAYLPGKVDYDRWHKALAANSTDPATFRQTCATIMAHHASTRERLPILAEFYTTLLAGLPPVTTIADLACGLNPLAIPWMNLPPNATYYASDLFHDQIAFLNAFFPLAGVDGKAQVVNLLSQQWTVTADVVLLLKVVPCLEQVEDAILDRLLMNINTRVLIISFPAQSLGGRRKGMPATYAARFQEQWQRSGRSDWSIEQFDFSTELAFRLIHRSPRSTHSAAAE